MSEGTPNDPGQPRMPWEPETPPAGPAEPAKRPDSGWTPPEPTDPTTVWTPPTPPTDQPASASSWESAPPPAHEGALTSSAPVRWVPPPAARGAVEVVPGLAFADTTSRAVAYIIDGIILGIIGGIIGAILNPAAVNPATTTSAADLRSLLTTAADPVGSVLIVVIDLAYFTVAWTGGRRATIGQRLFDIQVGNAFDGRALSTEQAVRRALGLGSWIGLIGIVPGFFLLSGLLGVLWSAVLFITTATSPTKQGLHDRFANTALVRPSDKETSGCATACLVVAIAIALLTLVSLLALYALSDQVITILSEIGESI